MQTRNKKSLISHKKFDDLTDDEKKARKKAKKIGINMMKNEKRYGEIVDFISHGLNIPSGEYCSQDLTDRYYELYMSDSEK